jgi:hypothetical protein
VGELMVAGIKAGNLKFSHSPPAKAENEMPSK